MKKVLKVKVGESVPSDARLIKVRKETEPLSNEELRSISWPGIGPVPEKIIDYAYYEVLDD